jgi:GAF domain-containing protein
MPTRFIAQSNQLHQDRQAVADVNSGGVWRAAVHPDDHTGMEKARSKAQTSGAVSEARYRLRMTGGNSRWHRAIASNALHLERLGKLDMYSTMVLPLVARGSTLGAVTFVPHVPYRRRPFDEQDVALATELVRRAALALDNARLFEPEPKG